MRNVIFHGNLKVLLRYVRIKNVSLEQRWANCGSDVNFVALVLNRNITQKINVKIYKSVILC